LALTLGTPNRVKPKVDVFEAASEQLDRCGGHISDDCWLDNDRVRRRGLLLRVTENADDAVTFDGDAGEAVGLRVGGVIDTMTLLSRTR